MREVLQLPHSKDGKSKTALFEKDKITELEDTEYKFLKDQKDGPFNFLVGEGTFVVIEDVDAEVEARKPSKLEKHIAKLQDEKEKKGDKFHHKSEAKLKKLLAELEDSKSRQGS